MQSDWNAENNKMGPGANGEGRADELRCFTKKQVILSSSDSSFHGGLRSVLKRKLLNNYKIIITWVFFFTTKLEKVKVDLFVIQSTEIKNCGN